VRLGSMASLASAIVTLLTSSIVPILVASAHRPQVQRPDAQETGYLDSLFRLWSFSQACTATLLLSTLVAKTTSQGIAIIALSGAPWALGQWVPYTIISSQATVGRSSTSKHLQEGAAKKPEIGATFGLYNAVVSLPQIVAGLLCVLVYGIATSAGSSIPTSWVLAASGLAALWSSKLALDGVKNV